MKLGPYKSLEDAVTTARCAVDLLDSGVAEGWRANSATPNWDDSQVGPPQSAEPESQEAIERLLARVWRVGLGRDARICPTRPARLSGAIVAPNLLSRQQETRRRGD